MFLRNLKFEIVLSYDKTKIDSLHENISFVKILTLNFDKK